MQIVIEMLGDLTDTIWNNITFSNLLALLAVGISVVAYWWSKQSVRAQTYVFLLREYASVEMCNSIRRLRAWFNECNEEPNNAVEKWWKDLTKEEPEPEAIQIDKARRYVDHYFCTVKEIRRAGLICSDFYEKLVAVDRKH